MKKILALFLTLMMLALGAGTVLADTLPGDPDTACAQANTEIQSVYGYNHTGGYFQEQNHNGSPFNHHHQWEAGIPLHGVTSHALIYGDPSAPDSTGFSRYLGETKDGENFTNIQHPYDVLDVSSLDQLNWIPQPWAPPQSTEIATLAAGAYGTIVRSPFDGLAGFGSGVCYHATHNEIMAGLKDSDPQYMSDPAANDTPWEDMTHIWDPPTRWEWGAGIMYDTGSTIPASDLANAPTVYYKTVLLPPLDPSYWPKGTLPVTGTTQSGGSSQNPSGNNSPGNSNPPGGNNPPGGTSGGSGSLALQAMSQAGTNIMGVYSGSAPRPAGTAKWGDNVTATLTAPVPIPPQGTITSWSVDSASLVYPQKASDYTYGDPTPPTGTKTISMTAGGQGATATFCEDWAEDGANIYSITQGKMIVTVPEPYTITVSYSGTMNYEYTITVPNGSGGFTTETETGSAPFGATVSGSLTVDGAGVTPAGE